MILYFKRVVFQTIERHASTGYEFIFVAVLSRNVIAIGGEHRQKSVECLALKLAPTHINRELRPLHQMRP